MTSTLDDARGELLGALNAARIALKNRDQSPFEAAVLAGLKIAIAKLESAAPVPQCDAESAVAVERERCAKIAVEFGAFPGERFIKEIRLMCGNAIADKIRETPAVSSADQGGGA